MAKRTAVKTKPKIKKEVAPVPKSIADKLKSDEQPTLTKEEVKKVEASFDKSANNNDIRRNLTNTAREYKEFLLKSAKVKININSKKTKATHIVKTFYGAKEESFGTPQVFNVNGLRVQVPIGVMTDVPEPIFEIWDSGQKLKRSIHNKIDESMLRGQLVPVYSD